MPQQQPLPPGQRLAGRTPGSSGTRPDRSLPHPIRWRNRAGRTACP